MKKLSEWLYKKADWKKTIIIGILVFIIVLLLFPFLSIKFSSTDLPLQLLDTNMNYTPQEAIEHIKSLTSQERVGNIKITLIADTIYPLIYSLLFSFILSILFKNYSDSSSLLKYINLFPLFAMLADITENFSIIALILSHPNYSNLAAKIASVATPIKWGCIFVILLIIAYRFSYLRGQQRRTNKS